MRESKIQEKIKEYLQSKGWYVMVMHGNAYQSGFPDLFCSHSQYGIRLIEVKKPNMEGSKFTDAQLREFPKMSANGAGVWVLTDDTAYEYKKLFKRPNWHKYMWKDTAH